MADELPYAEDVAHYWQTSRGSPDVWMERSKKVITDLGGEVLADGFGSAGGRAAYMLAFKVGNQSYKVVWPVLPTRSSKEHSAKVQAATMLFHDIKAKAITASVMGARVAFFSYMALPDGRTASELVAPELGQHLPLQLK